VPARSGRQAGAGSWNVRQGWARRRGRLWRCTESAAFNGAEKKIHNFPSYLQMSVYRPRITFLSATEYLVPSERFAGHIIYKVTVLASGRAQCECRAADLGKACKHRRLVLAAHAYRAHPSQGVFA